MKFNKYFLIAIGAAGLLHSCNGSDIPEVSLGLDDSYTITRMSKLALNPAFTGTGYQWTLVSPDGESKVVADTRDYIFYAYIPGTYTLNLTIYSDEAPFEFSTEIRVVQEEIAYSKYISSVYEYCPAPGQFVNEMPKYEEGDTKETMRRKAEESIAGETASLISLGSWGGYVVFSFDHTVANIPGEYDFRIDGNSFYGAGDEVAGSSEPGIVWVAFDSNMNGKPDDNEWYELRGSEFDNPKTVRDYSVTYTYAPNSTPVPSEDDSIVDEEYIKWTDIYGTKGFISKNVFHSQPYFPQWLDSNSMSFSGTLLPQNGSDLYGDGTYYTLTPYAWGYADNHPNNFQDLNSFDISNAVDADGKPVNLPGADFIKVSTGILQVCGWVGETSTEISGAVDLHIE